MGHDESDKRVKIIHEVIPANWDKGALSLAHEIREFLKSVVDEGTGIDSGGGDNIADLWPRIDGTEYHIQIQAKK